MIRFLVRTLIAVAAAAIGLIVAAIALSGVSINATSFIEAVIVFAIAYALLTPFLASSLRRSRSAALGGVALISTLAALVITDIISSGLSIHGITAWLAAAVIVWAASVLAAFLLPYLGLKKYLEERQN